MTPCAKKGCELEGTMTRNMERPTTVPEPGGVH